MKLKYINIAIAALLMFSACNKVLDKHQLDKFSPDLVFSDSTIVQLYLDYIYDQNLPDFGGKTTAGTLTGAKVELSEEGYASNQFMYGTYSYGTNDVGDFGTSLSVSNNWGKIRQINQFIKACEASSFPQYTINKFVGQALFFRAFRYWDMVRIYGGVPIVLTPLDGVGDSARAGAMLSRNKTSECIAQMVKDLDTAIQYLPGKWASSSDWGKITSGAAAALKGRILLYWASPLYNPNDLTDRWQTAYNANL